MCEEYISLMVCTDVGQLWRKSNGFRCIASQNSVLHYEVLDAYCNAFRNTSIPSNVGRILAVSLCVFCQTVCLRWVCFKNCSSLFFYLRLRTSDVMGVKSSKEIWNNLRYSTESHCVILKDTGCALDRANPRIRACARGRNWTPTFKRITSFFLLPHVQRLRPC